MQNSTTKKMKPMSESTVYKIEPIPRLVRRTYSYSAKRICPACSSPLPAEPIPKYIAVNFCQREYEEQMLRLKFNKAQLK